MCVCPYVSWDVCVTVSVPVCLYVLYMGMSGVLRLLCMYLSYICLFVSVCDKYVMGAGRLFISLQRLRKARSVEVWLCIRGRGTGSSP